MKKILSIKYSAGAFNFSMLLLRVAFGVLIIASHGYDKLQNFNARVIGFHSFLGLGSKISLILAIFAEVFCALFVVIGLFTRLSVIPLIITMIVAISASANRPILDSELAILYLAVFITLLFCGPGRISIDGMINK